MTSDDPDLQYDEDEETHRFKSCTSKKQLTLAKARELEADMGFRAYECRFCRSWHVARTPSTRQPKPTGRRGLRSRKKRKRLRRG